MGNWDKSHGIGLLDADLYRVVRQLPVAVRKLATRDKVYLAGGFVRSAVCGETPADIDFFGPDREKLRRLSAWLSDEWDVEPIETENAITVFRDGSTPVQFITHTLHDNATKLIHSFDFTVCKAAIWYDCIADKWDSRISPSFYAHLAGKRLYYECPKENPDASGSLMRVLKFARRGYVIDRESLAEIIACMLRDLDTGFVEECDSNEQMQDKLCNHIHNLLKVSVYQGVPNG